MWDLETIRRINQAATDKAVQEQRDPYMMREEEETIEWPPFPFPHLGYIETSGRKHVATLLCDHTGMGRPGEAALTADQLKDRLIELLREHGPLHIYIREQGPFQLLLSVEVSL